MIDVTLEALMRIALVPALIAFGFSVAAAAPALSLANMQAVGDVSTTIDVDTNSISGIGDPGTGVTWDFSGIGVAGRLATKRYGLAPSATPYAALYPNASHCERTVQADTKVDNYQYYLADGGSMKVIGAAGGVIDSTRYSDPDEVMKLPFTYGDSLYDSASLIQYVKGSRLQTEQGRTTVADGYGTLKLPNGTFTSVLRYKVTTDQAIKFLSSGGAVLSTIQYHVVDYFWADQGYHEFLFEYHPIMLKNGVQQSRRANYWSDPKAVGATSIRPVASGNKLRAESAGLARGGWVFRRDGIPALRNALGRAPASIVVP
jgi:hypothetical protein